MIIKMVIYIIKKNQNLLLVMVLMEIDTNIILLVTILNQNHYQYYFFQLCQILKIAINNEFKIITKILIMTSLVTGK